jgi:F-type H+-transporting ATPase subunit b
MTAATLTASAAYAAEPHGSDAGAEHGGEHAANFPPFDFELFPHQIIWFAIAFGLLYILMSRVALPGVAAVLGKREGSIKGDLAAADKAGAAAEEARQASEKAAAQARAQARKLIDDVRTKAQAELAAEQAKADEALAARIAAAEVRIGDARNKALGDVDSAAKALAQDIVGKLLPGGAR